MVDKMNDNLDTGFSEVFIICQYAGQVLKTFTI